MSRVDVIRPIGAISVAAVHVGTPELRGALGGMARRATDHLHVDLFQASDASVVDQLVSRAGDIRVSVLADTDNAVGPDASRSALELTRQLRRAIGDGWTALGGNPLKQHGKSASRDEGAEGLVATDLADAGAFERIELAVTFQSAPARSLAAVHAAPADDLEGLRRRLARAAADGVLVNDPRVPARHVTEGAQLLMRDPGAWLRIATEQFDSIDAVREIAAMGAAAELVTHSIPKAQRRTLAKAGVTVRVVDEERARRARAALHGTVIDSEHGVLVTSAYLVDRVMHGSPGRQSREVGVLLSDAAATAGRRAYDALLDLQR